MNESDRIAGNIKSMQTQGASEDEIQQYVDGERYKFPEAFGEASTTAKALGHPASRVASGMASLITGPFQLGANIGDKILDVTGENDYLGESVSFTPEQKSRMEAAGIDAPTYEPFRLGKQVNKVVKKLHDLKEEGRRNRGSKGFDWYELGGMVGSPGNLLKTGLQGATERVSQSLFEKSLRGSGTGAMYGAAVPVVDGDFFTEKAAQTGGGALIGGAIPSVVKPAGGAVKYLNELTKPLYEKGIARDVKKFLMEKAGSERERIIQALQKAREIVPGNRPTAGQAIVQAQRPGQDFGGQIVKLEKELSKTPVIGSDLKSVYSQQAAGREGVISDIAGSEADMARAVADRASRTSPLYKAVEQSKEAVETKPVLNKIDEILAKNPNETSITTPLGQLRAALLKDDGLETNPQALYSLSKEIKTMMGSITPGGQKEFNVGALNEIKALLDTQIGEAERAFGIAQRAYKAKSVPINRMEVGGELKGALVNALEKQTPSTFQGATRAAPRTLKRATGFNRYEKLEDVLSPEQTRGVKAVSEELVNQAKGKSMATDTLSIIKDLPGEVELSLPRILSRPIVVANHVLAMIGKDQTPRYKEMLVAILKDPQSLERALAEPVHSARYKMGMDILNKVMSSAPAQAAAVGER